MQSLMFLGCFDQKLSKKTFGEGRLGRVNFMNFSDHENGENLALDCLKKFVMYKLHSSSTF